MDGRDERIYREAAALWRELHAGEPAPGDAAAILDLLAGAQPPPIYERLCSPWLNASNVTWPRPSPKD